MQFLKIAGICLLVGLAVLGLIMVAYGIATGLENHSWWVYIVTTLITLIVIAVIGAIATIVMLYIGKFLNGGIPLLLNL